MNVRSIAIFLGIILGLGPLSSTVKAAADVRVVVSIRPLHSLVSALMQGGGEPVLLIKGGGSPHTYSLKPSDALSLRQAEVVFWVGEQLETFLAKPLEALAGDAHVVALGSSEPHHDHSGGEHTNHPWLDPVWAISMVSKVIATLIEKDPERTSLYRRNAKHLIGELTELDQETRKILTPVRSVPFIVFHDAYGAFEARYNLTKVGAVTLSAERRPGAKHLKAIRQTLIQKRAVCVFQEPQFAPGLVHALVAGLKVRVGVLTLSALNLIMDAGYISSSYGR